MRFVNTIETGSAHSRTQQAFIAAESKARINEIAIIQRLPRDKVSRMMVLACNEDMYHNDSFRILIGKVAFVFHIARYKVELRRAELV